MQKAAALLAIATVAMAGDKPNTSNQKDSSVTTLRFGFDDAIDRTIYQPELVDPMIIKPSTNIDPRILIRPRYDYNIDPKMIIRPNPYPRYPTYYYADDEELNIVSKVKEEAKKAAHFVSEHPELVIKAIEIIQKLHHHDDNDDEFFNIKEGVEKAGKFIVEHPEVVKQVEQKVEQVINRYKGHGDLLKQDAKKALDYVAQHPEVIKQVAQLVKNMAQHDDDELFAEPIYPIKAAPKKKGIVAADDDEFFNLKEGVEKAGKFISENPEVIKQVINKYKGNEDLLKQDAKKAFNFVTKNPEIMKQITRLVKNLDDDELFAEPIYPIKAAPKKKGFLAADDEDNELSVLGQMIKEGVKSQNGQGGNKNSDFGKKKIVSFDELNVDKIENIEFFEDNDLMCISLMFAGKPFQYCK